MDLKKIGDFFETGTSTAENQAKKILGIIGDMYKQTRITSFIKKTIRALAQAEPTVSADDKCETNINAGDCHIPLAKLTIAFLLSVCERLSFERIALNDVSSSPREKIVFHRKLLLTAFGKNKNLADVLL